MRITSIFEKFLEGFSIGCRSPHIRKSSFLKKKKLSSSIRWSKVSPLNFFTSCDTHVMDFVTENDHPKRIIFRDVNVNFNVSSIYFNEFNQQRPESRLTIPGRHNLTYVILVTPIGD